MDSTDPLLDEQIAYYRARAAEYDEWFLRQGRYDQGSELNARWAAEADEVAEALDSFGPRGRVLELAGGTGIWTQKLARAADELTVVDASPEVIAINRVRVGDSRVRYVQADLFTWEPDTQYDVVFFGFWLSHVPPERFASFWSFVARCLAPNGRAFLVDNLAPSTTSSDHQPTAHPIITRQINDGREFQIYKLWYTPHELAQRLGALGWQTRFQGTSTYFTHGWASREPSPLTIRRYRDEDHDAVWWLHNLALQQAGAHAGNGPWDDDLHRIPEVYLSAGDFLVGEIEGQVVGMGAIQKKTDDCAEIKRMRVHPGHQRRGFGQQILDAIEQRARALGYARVFLETTVQQIAAQALYTKNGFAETGRGSLGPFEIIFYEKKLI